MNKPFSSALLWLRRHRSPWLEYGILSLLVLGPLLLPGFVLTLDLVFVPEQKWPDSLTNTYLLEAFIWLVGLILPGDVIEKIILFMILVLSGAGMHLLVRRMLPEELSSAPLYFACYVAGIFYMINPFTYARFMAGQWMFLLGYALLPFFVYGLYRLISHPTVKQGVITGSLGALIMICSIHHAALLIIVATLACLAVVFRPHRQPIKAFFAPVAASLGTFLLLSLTWIIPLFTGALEASESASKFNAAHFEAFSTDGGNTLGRLLNVIRLQGFWAESQQLFALPQQVTPGWGIVFAFAWTIIGMGGVAAWHHARPIAIFAGGVIITGILLSATSLIQWSASIIPLLGGYREPHKFANLIALGFAILLAFGAAHLLTRVRRPGNWSAALLFVPLLLTPTMLWGFAGQLSPRQYPEGWWQLQGVLTNTPTNKKAALFLPWHQYASYSFSDRIIANPSEKFFSRSVIASDDPEFGNITPTSPSPIRSTISRLLDHRPDDIAARLLRLGIDRIIIAKEQDYQNYEWLTRSHGVQHVYSNDDITLYKLEDAP